MAGWKIEATKRIYLPDDIADDIWIAIPHPKLLPYDDMKAFMGLATKASSKTVDGQPNIAGFDFDAARDVATTLIRDWNLPDSEGKTLPIPSQDESVWQRIPAMPVIMSILEALDDGVEEAEPDPNSSEGLASTSEAAQ